MSAPRPKQKGSVYSGIAIIVVFLASVFGVAALLNSAPSATPTPGAGLASVAAATKPTVLPPFPKIDLSEWEYSDDTDAMDKSPTHLACNISLDEVKQSWPYHNTAGRLCLRRAPRSGLNAILQLSEKRQILCGFEDCHVNIRFDNGPVRRFDASESNDHSSNALFIEGAPALVGALRKSKQTVLEITLYQNGTQHLTFNVAGLKWK